jgi:hypothetical protein
MPNRRHPSRLVVFSRSSIWKKGTGDSESVAGGPPGIFATTASTVHVGFAFAAPRRPDAFETSAHSLGDTTQRMERVLHPLQLCNVVQLTWSAVGGELCFFVG